MAKQVKLGGLKYELELGIAKFTQTTGQAQKQMSAMQKSFDVAAKGINTAFKAIVTAVAVREVFQLSTALLDLSERGEVAGSIADSFQQLGGSSTAIEDASKKMLGMVSSFDLMKIANEGMLKQIPGLNENFGLMADYAGKYADAVGIDGKDALVQLVDAMTMAKEVQLKGVGITINAAKAYEDFGKKIGVAAEHLDKAQQTEARQLAALEALKKKNSELAAIEDSVANARDGVNRAMDDGLTRIGIAINENEKLTEVYREFEKQLDSIEWEQMGQAAAEFFAVFLGFAQASLPKVSRWLDSIALGFRAVFNVGHDVEAVKLNDEIKLMEENLDKLNKQSYSFDPLGVRENQRQSGVSALTQQIEERKKKLDETWEAMRKDKQALTELSKINSDVNININGLNGALKTGIKNNYESADALTAHAKEADKAAKEIEKLTKEHNTFLNTFKANGMEGKDLFDQAADDAQQQAIDRFNIVASTLGGAFDGVASDFGQALDDVFSTMSERMREEIGDGISEALGLSSEELEQWAGAIGNSLNAVLNASSIDSDTKSNKGTGGAIGSVGGSIIGSILGNPELGSMLGKHVGSMIGSVFKWGPQNPEAKARHAFADFVEEGFKKLEQLSFFDAEGRIQNMKGSQFNLLENRDRFSQGGWADEMDQWGNDARKTFTGIGEALEEVLGLTEDVGGQLGFILGEQLLGNIDNARLAVLQLGLSLEEMESALVEAGLNGEMRWHEVEVSLQGVSEAFKPGIAAVGDMKGAMDELIGSGGRGIAALKGVRDIAVEAMEAGATSLDQLAQRMVAQGIDPTLVQNFMAALEQRGIKTLEELAAASDRVAGGIVADLESSNDGLRKQWEQMSEDLERFAETMEKIPDKKDIELNVTTNFDSNTEDLMNADIIPEPDVGEGMMGDAEPSRLRAATRARATTMKAGVSGNAMRGVTLVVNAPGADAGVEARIMDALASVQQQAIEGAVSIILDNGY